MCKLNPLGSGIIRLSYGWNEINESIKMNIPNGCSEIILGYICRNGEDWVLFDEA